MSLEYRGREEGAGPGVAVQTVTAAGQTAEWSVPRESGAEKPSARGLFPDSGMDAGRRIHLYAFAASVLLTLLAFGAALYGELPADLLVPFLMLMTAIQMVLQLVYGMRLRSRNDLFSILSLAFGTVLTLVAVGAALYWVWI